MASSQILLIEDDLSIARLERDYLEIEGYQVTHVTDGRQGLDFALKASWDLVIIDLMLPGLDGFEICRQLRTELDIPLLVVSARSEDIDKIRALGLGADDYVTKPFSPAELVARVKSHIKMYQRLVSKASDSGEINSGSLSIQLKSHRVFVDNREVTLTTKEFELLYFLASNPDIVFSREQIFEKIWSVDNYGDIGAVAVYIQKIRKKIEKDPAEPVFIETVWGAGYRFAKK
jgi:DNA-binding response OmpR family regulator